jgi:hypothetical protein
MKLSILKVSTALLSIVCIGWTAGFFYYFMSPSQSDLVNYSAAVDQIQQLTIKPTLSSANQYREGVRKDIWAVQNKDSRLHYRIDSRLSTLSLVPVNDHIDAIETLEDIRCWMQEKLYLTGSHPMQQLRFFSAQSGTYEYKTQKFLAKSVELSLFRLPTHQIPNKLNMRQAFLKGIAQDVSFSVSGDSPQFHAEHFKATLISQTLVLP